MEYLAWRHAWLNVKYLQAGPALCNIPGGPGCICIGYLEALTVYTVEYLETDLVVCYIPGSILGPYKINLEADLTVCNLPGSRLGLM
jgi:hypothetical protein